MASTSNDQENVLLPSDEESPSGPPPPAGRLPIKPILAAGLCLAAAGLAGAVVMGTQATRAPPQIKHSWADLISLATKHWQKYLSEECHDLLEAMEKEAEESGRFVGYQPVDTVCKNSSEQKCVVQTTRWRSASDWGPMTMAQCLPSTCKQENIFKAMEEDMIAVSAMAGTNYSDLVVNCLKNGEELPEVREPWEKYLSQECYDLLQALEKEAEDSWRVHDWHEEGPAGSEVDCKATEAKCTVGMTICKQEKCSPGQFETTKQEKCFPAVCKQENIFKGMEEFMGAHAAKMTGLEVTCLKNGELGSDKSAGLQLSCFSFSFLASVSLIFIARI